MKVIVTGASGLIGSALAASLEADGHQVTRLVRSEPSGPGQVRWAPEADEIADVAALEGHDGAVHLAGPSIGGHRWTDGYKRELRDARVKGTDLLARALGALDRPPTVLVSGSAVGFYGDCGDEPVTEASSPGTGFLADLVRDWEAAAAPAAEAGVRVVNLRTGIVLARHGGALEKMLLPFKLGVGGRMGSGKQWFSWVALDDEVGAVRHTLADPSVRGPVNVTSPQAVTNAQFAKALGRALRRPTLMPVPTAALNALLGKELVAETILAGQRVYPAALEAAGYTFAFPDLDAALAHVLNKPAA